MNLLRQIIERLNQRIEVANIFDKQFGLCELNANGNDKAWVHYIGNGQAEVVTNFDAKNGTLFWAKRGKVTVSKTDAYKVSGCKQLYITSFPLTAYAIVKKSHLPCDSEDAQDWLASRIYKLSSGTDPLFKQSIGVINYEVVPSGYINEIKTLTANYEWACVSVDVDVQVITSSEDGCYDTCATGDIPLPDLQPCTPCLTEVAVDGVTIIGNGTAADPLSAVGGGGGTPLRTQNEGTNVSTNTTTLNFTGAGVTASLTSPGVVEVNVPAASGGGVTSVTGTAPIASSGGATPDISISQADATTDGYLSSADWTNFDGKFNVPTGTSADYLDGTGTPTPFPTLPTGTVTSVDLTMPPAFSVSGNPVTSSGTLAVAAAGLSSQYIRGDGQLANFPTNQGGGSSVSYYLNGSVTQDVATYKEMSRTPILGAGTDFQRTNAQGNGLIAQFITDAGDPNLLSIPAGNWNLELFFSASSGGGSPSFYVELYKYDGVTFTLIATDSATPEGITNGTTIDAYFTALAVPATTLTATDRLAIRVFVTTSGRTITLHTENSHLCQVITTFSTGLTALNGLTEQVQNLAVGTSGTDFGISSVTDTHTFNLPTASATNRGALSSTDWTTFNNKQDALSSGTNIKTINSTSILGSGNIATPFELVVAASDESTALTTGTAKITFRMPRAVTLTSVRASLTTAQASGSIFTVDINENSTSILSTKLTIDNTEKTSFTAATPPVISDTALADDAEITIDIDQIGDGTAKGLKVMLIGTVA
jgi:hypothetical protein